MSAPQPLPDSRLDPMLEQCLGRLEEIDAELAGADPDEMPSIALLLKGRAEAVARIAAGLEGTGGAPPGSLLTAPAAQALYVRLGAAAAAAAKLEERLKLTRASARQGMRELYYLQFHARALAASATGQSEGVPSATVSMLG